MGLALQSVKTPALKDSEITGVLLKWKVWEAGYLSKSLHLLSI